MINRGLRAIPFSGWLSSTSAVHGMRAHWPGLLVRVTCFRPGRMTGVSMVYLVQHGDKERLPGGPGLTALGRQQASAPAGG